MAAVVEVAPRSPAMLCAQGGEAGLDWIREHRDSVLGAWAEHGALLLRGFGLGDPATLVELARELGVEVTSEREPFAPRQRFDAGAYSSVSWPAEQTMCLHHENSYAATVPRSLVLGCAVPPTEGGATGLADAAAVLAALPAELVAPFERDGWVLRRMYSELAGTPWQEAFGTDDPRAVERYCRDADITAEWLPDGGLRTTQRRPAVVTHPSTGRRGWFNQIAFFSEWSLEPEVREYLLFEFGEDGLPFNSWHADGTPVSRVDVDTINRAYDDATLREPWQAGDALLIDNLRIAHSREPFSGRRDVAMVFGDPTPIGERGLT